MSVYRETRPPASGALRFDELAPDTRALLTASCRGDAAPVPLLRSSFVVQGHPWVYLTVAALLLALAAGVFHIGIGSLGEWMPPDSMAQGLSLLVGLALALVALAWRSRHLRGGLPFPAGDYLFARDLLMARRGQLTLIPTRSLAFLQETPRRLAVLRLDAPRERIAVFTCEREGLVEELLAERDALERAEQADDMATRLRLDPFLGERTGRPGQDCMRVPYDGVFDSSPRLALLVGALLVTSAVAVPPLSARLVHAVKRFQIARAEDEIDARSLATFLSLNRVAPASLREAAEEALFRITMRSGTWEDLLAYLKRGGPHAVEVSDEYLRRFCRDRTFYGYGPLAEWGRGPARDEADAFMFERAIRDEGEGYLYDYLRYGARRDEVRRNILPRRQLDRAIRQGDLENLRRIKARWEDRSGFVSEEQRLLPSLDMMQELTQAIDTLIDQHRVHLRERTGLRTSLARGIHQQLGKTLTLAPALAANSHLFTETRVALEQVITTYVPRSLMELEKYDEPLPYHSPSFSGPPTIVLDLEPLNPCRQLPCRRRLQLVFHDFGDAELPPQVVSFTEPARDSGRTFEMAVTEALTGALLGDEKR